MTFYSVFSVEKEGAAGEGVAEERGTRPAPPAPPDNRFGSKRSHLAGVAASAVCQRSTFDDYYSPVKPADYIEQRLRPAIAFYQRRLPLNTCFGMVMKVLLLIATVASSVLARYKYSQLVTIATAFASMITAYSEFADTGRKVERCVHLYIGDIQRIRHTL